MIDLVALDALRAVGTHGSVVAAADALGFTPSAVSQQVKRLEKQTGVPLLERVSDARRDGATIFTLDQGDPELDALAHEAMTIAPGPGVPGMMSFGAAQHLVSAACGELGRDGDFGSVGRPGTPGYQRYRPGVRGLKDRVAHLLDVVSGPTS